MLKKFVIFSLHFADDIVLVLINFGVDCSFPFGKAISCIRLEDPSSEAFKSSLNLGVGAYISCHVLDVTHSKIHQRLSEYVLNTKKEGFLLFGCMSPAHENHSLSADECLGLVCSFHPIHDMNDSSFEFVADITRRHHINILLLPQTTLLLLIMLDHLLLLSSLNLKLLDLFQGLSLPIVAHKADEHLPDLLKLDLSVVVKSLLEDFLLVLLLMDIILPYLELSMGRLTVVPHEVVTNLTVGLLLLELSLSFKNCFLLTSFHLETA